MLFRRSVSAPPLRARTVALEELTREADEIFRLRNSGELSLIEAEEKLELLRSRYETPLDRFIAAG